MLKYNLYDNGDYVLVEKYGIEDDLPYFDGIKILPVEKPQYVAACKPQDLAQALEILRDAEPIEHPWYHIHKVGNDPTLPSTVDECKELEEFVEQFLFTNHTGYSAAM